MSSTLGGNLPKCLDNRVSVWLRVLARQFELMCADCLEGTLTKHTHVTSRWVSLVLVFFSLISVGGLSELCSTGCIDKDCKSLNATKSFFVRFGSPSGGVPLMVMGRG